MFIFLFISFLFLIGFNFFNAENVVTVLVGFITTAGLTQYLKGKTGLQGVGAMWLSIALSLVVAAVAVIISMIFNDGGFSVEKLAGSGVQIWAVAQITYKLILADK